MRRILLAGVVVVFGACLAADDGRNNDQHISFCTGNYGFGPNDLLLLEATPIVRAICDYVATASAKTTMSIDAWTPKVVAALSPIMESLRAILPDEGVRTIAAYDSRANMRIHLAWPKGWGLFCVWIDELSLATGVMELSALSAILREHFWTSELQKSGAFGPVWLDTEDSGISDNPAQTLMKWKRSGNRPEAERFFQRMLDFEDGRTFPFRYFYDTLDVHRVDGCAWPGLPRLNWPNPEDVLPEGVAAALRQSWRVIADEARKLAHTLRQQGDAYAGITRGEWTKLDVYSPLTGWNATLCKSLPTVCNILKGKMRTELMGRTTLMDYFDRQVLDPATEGVILFNVKSDGHAHMHFGTATRVNTHLCLLDCNASRISVASEVRDYHDGSFFAFEDRADHEIFNSGAEDRINLAVAVLHPSWKGDVMPLPFAAKNNRLQFVLQAIDAHLPLRQATLDAALLLATRHMYVSCMEKLLQHGADVRAIDPAAKQPVHFAAEQSRRQPLMAAAALRLLIRHGADLLDVGPNGSASEILSRMNPGLLTELRYFITTATVARSAGPPDLPERIFAAGDW